MAGADRKEFDWKEIAETLRMTRVVARVAFWREIKRSRLKKVEAPPSATVVQNEGDTDALRLKRNRSKR